MGLKNFIALVVAVLPVVSISAAERPDYEPARVVYDVSTANSGELNAILDRVSHLQNLYEGDSFNAAIVLVLHEGAIPLLANKNKNRYRQLRQRTYDLTLGNVVSIRICRASARMQGFTETDFPPFTHSIPMADAEIIKLQHTGYAYLK